MNAGKHYIEKALNRAAAVAVALCFFVTSLLCCCLPGKAHAEVHGTVVKSQVVQARCCSTANHKAHSENKKSCNCTQMSRSAADQPLESFNPKSVFEQFSKVSAVVQSFFHQNFDSTFTLAYNGPPGFKKSIPIYLQISNLRL